MTDYAYMRKYEIKKSFVYIGQAVKQRIYSVGVKGFEPSTPCSQSRCANRTALRPERNKADGFIFRVQSYGDFCYCATGSLNFFACFMR